MSASTVYEEKIINSLKLAFANLFLSLGLPILVGSPQLRMTPITTGPYCSSLSKRTRKSKFADVMTKAALSTQLFKNPEFWFNRDRISGLLLSTPALIQLN